MISANIQSERLDEILSHEIQTGTDQLSHKGYDITFSNVRFSYDRKESVLKDVTFTAKQGEGTDRTIRRWKDDRIKTCG